jgi:hypothetical protein
MVAKGGEEMKTILPVAALVLLASSPMFSQTKKTSVEVAREDREARLRNNAEETVDQTCAKADDPKVQETYPGIQQACKDKPRLIQALFESSLKQSSNDLILAQAQAPAEQRPAHLTGPMRRTIVFQSTLSAVKEFCDKKKDNPVCSSKSTEYDAASKIVEKSPELQAYINTGVLPDKQIKLGSIPALDKSDDALPDTSWHYGNGAPVSEAVSRALASQDAPPDSVAAAQARVDRACRHDLSMTVAEITTSMVDCNKAYSDLQNAISTRGAAQTRARAAAMRGSIPGNDYLISLTGTPGLPVTGTCSFAGKGESYDDILPAQHVATAGRGVLCSFVKKYVQGTLKIQIIQNGTVRDQAETEASYGTVSVTVDW